MKNNDALKKHHFWILFGIVPLFSLIGVQCISSNVGGAIAKKDKEVDDTKKKIASKTNPKPQSLIAEADKLIEQVGNKSGGLHKENWERQKDLFTWPNSELLKEIEQKGLKFGDPLPSTRGQFDEFRNPAVYEYEFSSIPKTGTAPPGPGTGMADRVAPTQFRGGWRSVLRYVNEFPQVNITSDQVWLIMEDIWVQRSLLSAIRSVNDEMATFRRAVVNSKGDVSDDPTYDEQGRKVTVGKDQSGKPTLTPVPTPEKEKLKARFHNRIWSIELEVVPEGDARRLTGTLTNQSERLQLMGAGNMMTLRVWFSHSPTDQPTVFRIGGEFLPGKGAMKRDKDGRDVPANVLQVVPTPEHILPPGKQVNEIVRIEQVFDVRTVPIKRIDALVMGKTDSRIGDEKPLALPAFIKEPAPADPATPPAGGLPGGKPGGPTGGPPGAPAGGPPAGLPMGGLMGGQQTAQGQPAGGGPIAAVIDGNKRRYLPDGVTDQVRRMPVGIVVVVDQSYIQDVLLAFANSPLRFQITQVSWTRYRGNDLAIGSSGSSGTFGDSNVFAGSGRNNVTGSGDPDSKRPPGGRAPIGPPSGFPGPGGPPGPGNPLGGPPGGFPGPGGFPSGSNPGATPSIASESQITAGLVELSIYGVVSLYEKYTDPAQGAPPVAPGAQPAAPGVPPVPPAAPGVPPGPPMNPTTPPAKKRRRVRM